VALASSVGFTTVALIASNQILIICQNKTGETVSSTNLDPIASKMLWDTKEQFPLKALFMFCKALCDELAHEASLANNHGSKFCSIFGNTICEAIRLVIFLSVQIVKQELKHFEAAETASKAYKSRVRAAK